ncbi:Werner Syndrome-like exonuclease isoform X2 [Rosa chinensis]|uniref:Werner Syndrome-like exonuclease isoform X2 n=1 Tax=Rosa chinensis TaxID=74649 RepID=UPI000D08E431|nr:Werner Syndrome-like exonuclease isoform X2 [Rosa chinensis]XP_040363330.1 Werner Syndrome-like exonuclease isoform X2 [Rosa chinensis]
MFFKPSLWGYIVLVGSKHQVSYIYLVLKTRMAISIVDHELPYDTHNLYDVTFYNDQIHTLVTHSAPMVESWLSEIMPIINENPIVGLDVEWRPNFNSNSDHPIATLQLCVDHRCLIFQLIHAQNIPQSLFDFLANGSYKFVGAGIQNDTEKLLLDYDLKVTNTVNLGALAATKLGRSELKNAGLKGLSKEVLRKELQKSRKVTMSRWDNEWLTCNQVQYACIDAFISSEIGRQLTAMA